MFGLYRRGDLRNPLRLADVGCIPYRYQIGSNCASGMDPEDAVAVGRDAFPRFVFRLCACCKNLRKNGLVLRRSDQPWTRPIAAWYWYRGSVNAYGSTAELLR